MITVETAHSSPNILSVSNVPELRIDSRALLEAVDCNVADTSCDDQGGVLTPASQYEALLRLAQAHVPSEDAPDHEREAYAMRLHLLGAVGEGTEIRAALREYGYEINSAITGWRLASDLADWLCDLQARPEIEKPQSAAIEASLGRYSVASFSMESIEPAVTPLDIAMTTVYDLRERYHDLLSTVSLAGYDGEHIDQDEVGQLLAMAKAARAEPAGDEHSRNTELVRRGKLAQDILLRMHIGIVEQFVRQHSLGAPYDDIVYDKGVQVLHGAVSGSIAFNEKLGKLSSFVRKCMSNQLVDITRSPDYRYHARASVHARNVAEDTPGVHDVEEEALERIENQVRRGYIPVLMSGLDSLNRAIVSMSYGLDGYPELTIGEMAANVGMRSNVVSARLYRSKLYMRRAANTRLGVDTIEEIA